MAKIRFLNTNRFTGATLTASAEQEGAPAAAAQDADRNYQWLSPQGTGTRELEIDLGSALACNAVAIANADRLGSGVVELYERGSSASPGAATLVATLPAENADRRTSFVFFGSQTERHWQLKWTNPGADSEVASLGFAFLGTYLEPTVNVSSPIDVAELEADEVVLSVDRQRRTVTRTPYSVGRWTWDDVGQTDRDNLVAMRNAAGVSTPTFVVLDTALAWTCWLQWLGPRMLERLEVGPSLYSLELEWEEAT